MTEPESTNTRKRRFRYTYVACEKCKARKSKCSGEQPCRRCRENNLTCFYSRTTRFRVPRRPSVVAAAQEDDATAPNLTRRPGQSSNGAELNANATPSQPSEPSKTSPTSATSRAGDDSFEQCLRLAESRFAATNMTTGSSFSPGRRTAKFGSEQMRQAVANRKASPSGSVLEVFDTDCWIQILQTYEEEIGLQYPAIDIRHLSGRICQLKASSPVNQSDSSPSIGGSAARNVNDMALVLLAIVSAFVDPAAVDVSTPCIEEICGTNLTKAHLGDLEVEGLQLLMLTCMFFFLSDREKQAWRVIGVVMRFLQELSSNGDKDSHGNHIPDSLFWTVYTLDRRWSSGTGLTFAVQDEDITRIPPPSNYGDLSSAYLAQMVVFCGITSEARTKFLNSSSKCRATLDAARDLVLFRITQWHQYLPERLKFHGTHDRFDPAKEKRGDYKLRLMLYLRSNLMRTIILRKSATRFGLGQLDETSAQNMAQIAHDSIRVLSLLVQDTDIYHAQHKTFNHFLETALSALLLVMCNGSEDSGNETTPDVTFGPAKTTSYLRAIMEATELVQRLAILSPITQRLKNKLQGIQKFIDAMVMFSSRTDAFQGNPQDGTDSAAYWGTSGSSSGVADRSNQDSSTRQNRRSTDMTASLGPSTNFAGSDLPVGGATNYSDHYPMMETSYNPQSSNRPNNLLDQDPAASSTLPNYDSFMAMSEAVSGGMQNSFFSPRAMETAIADVGISAFSDLNGILMDYDNLLF